MILWPIYILQLIMILGPMLERPLIKNDFDSNFPKVVKMMDDNIFACKEIYDTAMEVRWE